MPSGDRRPRLAGASRGLPRVGPTRLAISLVALALSCGCGAGATVVGMGILLTGSDGGDGGTPRTVLGHCSFVDANDDGLVDPGDIVTVTFTREVSLQGSDPVDGVFVLDPPGSFGSTATIVPGPAGDQVTILAAAGVSLQPNGAHGVDPGSSGIDLAPGQTAIVPLRGSLAPLGTPVEIEGEVRPRVVSAEFVDLDDACAATAGDEIEVTFTGSVDFLTADPDLAFGLPVAGDTFGFGATILGGAPVGATSATVILGSSPVLTVTGTFDPANLLLGSPSGVDVTSTPGRIVDTAFPSISAAPRNPPGAEVSRRPGVSSWTDVGDDQAGASFGFCAAAVDIDADPFLEVVVGAPDFDTATSSDAGRIYVYSRPAAGGEPLELIDAFSGADHADAHFGRSASPAGNVNGDAYGDVIVGEPGFDPGTARNTGKVYLFRGVASGGLLSVPLWETTGDGARETNFGWSVASAGDADGDLFPDIIVGAPGPTMSGTGPGKVFLYYGNGATFSATPWTSTGGGEPRGRVGASVAAGDVDGDGLTDIIFGAPGPGIGPAFLTGKAFLFLGDAASPVPSPGWPVAGDAQSGAEFGASVASAVDVNADGYDDILVGAPRYDTASSQDAGKAYLYLGGPGGPAWVPSWESSGDDRPKEEFGGTVSTAGDVNNDGFDDVIVAAAGPGPAGTGPGTVHLFLGGDAWPYLTPAWSGTADDQGGAMLGTALAAPGDLIGADGRAEVLLGAPGLDTPNADAGKVYLFRFCLP